MFIYPQKFKYQNNRCKSYFIIIIIYNIKLYNVEHWAIKYMVVIKLAEPVYVICISKVKIS